MSDKCSASLVFIDVALLTELNQTRNFCFCRCVTLVCVLDLVDSIVSGMNQLDLYVKAKSRIRVLPHQTLPRYTPGSASRISSRTFLKKKEVSE